MATFKLRLVASNNEGNKIFAVLTLDKKRLAKGFFDFNTEHFTVERYYDKNFPPELTKKHVKAILREKIMTEHDWDF